MSMVARKPFEPKGDVAQWVPIYQMVRALEPGDLATYEDLEEVGFDRIARAPLYRAVRELEREDKRTLRVEQNAGYRVCHASEHLSLVQGRRKRASRQLRKGRSTFDATRVEELDAEMRRQHDAFGLRLSALEQAHRRTSKRVDEQEKRAEKLASADAAHEQELDQIKALLKKHGLV